jgi:hypothetical protein
VYVDLCVKAYESYFSTTVTVICAYKVVGYRSHVFT